MQLKYAVLALLSVAMLSGAMAAPANPPVAASSAVDDDTLVFITARYANRAQLQRIASHFQHLSIDDRAKTARVEATRDDIIALRRAGIDVQIDDAATLQLRQSETALHGAAQADAITGFPCYRTVDETYATMDQLAQGKPNLARVVDIGPTWLEARQAGTGHRMRALVVTNFSNSNAATKADMVLFGSIHAREYTPAELLMRFAEWLVNNYGTDPQATWLLDSFRFHFILQANPDGREKAETGLSWRKNVDDRNGSCSATSYGIDLNRNFPFVWNSVAGGSSGNACDSTYRGPQRLSENEAQNLMRYVAGTPNAKGVYSGGVFPDRRGDAVNSTAPSDYRGMFIDLHSYNRVVLWPWAFSTAPSPNASALRTLGRRMAWFTNYKPEQWVNMYAADGTTTDTMYGLLGVPSYAIELGVAFFESCSTFEGTTLPANMEALRYAARNLWAPYLYPSGPATTTISISATNVPIGKAVSVTATVDDTQFNQSNGTEPVQNIASASAYLDQQPWTPGATPIAMHATDGAFNAAHEVVTGGILTFGLRPGRHVVFVQGTDADGHPGTPLAAYFNVLPW